MAVSVPVSGDGNVAGDAAEGVHQVTRMILTFIAIRVQQPEKALAQYACSADGRCAGLVYDNRVTTETNGPASRSLIKIGENRKVHLSRSCAGHHGSR